MPASSDRRGHLFCGAVFCSRDFTPLKYPRRNLQAKYPDKISGDERRRTTPRFFAALFLHCFFLTFFPHISFANGKIGKIHHVGSGTRFDA
jgi:hypothetical protein